ncbi:hypothetical protein OSTOST_21046 [Ostertagia ostertagi]
MPGCTWSGRTDPVVQCLACPWEHRTRATGEQEAAPGQERGRASIGQAIWTEKIFMENKKDPMASYMQVKLCELRAEPACIECLYGVRPRAISSSPTEGLSAHGFKEKASPALANQSSLYSFALREVIVATYALLASVFFFVAAVQRNYGLVIASAVIQIICLVALSQLLSPSRLSAVLVNSRVLAIDNSSYPVAQVNVVLLYSFIVTLLFVISTQFIATVISLRSHSTTNTSTSHNVYPQQRTSF